MGVIKTPRIIGASDDGIVKVLDAAPKIVVLGAWAKTTSTPAVVVCFSDIVLLPSPVPAATVKTSLGLISNLLNLIVSLPSTPVSS